MIKTCTKIETGRMWRKARMNQSVTESKLEIRDNVRSFESLYIETQSP